MPEPRLVTAFIENELAGELKRRGIVVWLDKDAHYVEYVDDLAERHAAGDFPYQVVPFRGSFLEMMLALEDLEGGLDPTPVLIHMPGFTEDAMRTTPLLELYRAGFRHRRALDTAIREAATGRLPPDEIESYLATSGITLKDADTWLAGHVGEGRVGLAGLLDNTSLDTVVRELLIKNTFLAGHLDKKKKEDLDVLCAYFERQLGMTAAWIDFIRGGDTQSRLYTVITDALASWILCVEYADDLRREPHLAVLRPLKALPKQIITTCRDLARGFREQHPYIYEGIADQVEAHLRDELQSIRPEDLGHIDTFRTEEARILEAAIEAIIAGEFAKPREWSLVRASEASFWLGRDQRRKITWSLVADATLLGCLLDAHPRPFENVASFEDALTRYTAGASEVDLAQRHFEQRRADVLGPQLPYFLKLKEAVDTLRRRYTAWANDLARDFSLMCGKKGMLPDAALQQRTIYEQVVHPLTQGGEKVAVFLIDALRYEMAAELMQELTASETKGTKVHLGARFAELPTITSVGMNALAPVSMSGRLTLAGSNDFHGFKSGEFTVNNPDSRARAMGQRSVGAFALSLKLTEVCESEPSTLKNRVAQKKLIVVHDSELDDAGEAGVGLNAFEKSLGQIKAAWHHLKNAGVKQFVFTSDHGFLLVDGSAEPRSYGKKTTPNRRHVLAGERRKENGLLTVSLAELGYDGREGFLLFTEDTTVFNTGERTESYVHGGNSPQERIIPVLTVTSKYQPNMDLSAYRILASQESDAVGCHRLRVRLELDKEQTVEMSYARSAPIELALRVPSRSELRAVIKDVTGAGATRGGRLQIPVSDAWSEVFFTLEGPEDERVRVEIHHPDGVEQVAPCQVDGWFDVEGKVRRPTIEPPAPEQWETRLPDDGTRKIFVHLFHNGSISEEEAMQMMGSARNLRRFSNRFDELKVLVPFHVLIEQVAGVKRYVRKGRTDGTR